MATDVTYQLVGYEPESGSLIFEQNIPEEAWRNITPLLTHDDNDPEFAYSYPLEWPLANDIMGILHKYGNKGLNYYIESFAHA